jgi:hypothetical protein
MIASIRMSQQVLFHHKNIKQGLDNILRILAGVDRVACSLKSQCGCIDCKQRLDYKSNSDMQLVKSGTMETFDYTPPSFRDNPPGNFLAASIRRIHNESDAVFPDSGCNADYAKTQKWGSTIYKGDYPDLHTLRKSFERSKTEAGGKDEVRLGSNHHLLLARFTTNTSRTTQ